MSMKLATVSEEVYTLLLLKEKSIRTEFVQLKVEFNNQIDEMQAMDTQIENLNRALAESDLKRSGTFSPELQQECEDARRDLEVSKKHLSQVTAAHCEKELHLTHMCSQIDECSAYISKFKALCFEQLSPNVRAIQKDFVTIDAHVKRLESVCREKSILTSKLQCEIDSLSIGQEECERYQVELGSMKTQNLQLNEKLEHSDKTVEIFETQLQDARKEIQQLEITVENNIQDTTKMQGEIEHLTASVSLTIDENSFKKLEIENLTNQLVQATGLHERDSHRSRETEDELAYIKSQVEHHSVIGVDGNEEKIEYKTRIDSEILTCISRKNCIEGEIQVAMQSVKVQKQLFLMETSNHDMLEIEITAFCRDRPAKALRPESRGARGQDARRWNQGQENLIDKSCLDC